LAKVFGYPIGQIEPVYSSEFKQIAERPKNSCLRVEKTERFLGTTLFSVERGIKEMKRQESAAAVASS
jgi:dTDP-4-dehydrorhamnose reductase